MEASDLVMYIVTLTFLGVIASIAIALFALHKINQYRLSLHQLKLTQELSEQKHLQFSKSLVPMGERIVALELKAQELKHNITTIQEYQPMVASGHYQQARTIADLGGDEDVLIHDCGLTKIEAQMIKAMQNR